MVKRYPAIVGQGSDRHYGKDIESLGMVECVAASDYAALAERCERLEWALRDLIAVADPVALAPREYERIREQTARGTCVSIDPFPLLKCRYEDVIDLTDGLKRARDLLSGSSGGKDG